MKKYQEERLRKTKDINKQINAEIDSSLEEITKIIIYIHNNELTEDELSERIIAITDLVYDFLERVYSITSSSIKDIYNLSDTIGLSQIQPYSGDGITLEERVQRWIQEEINSNNDSNIINKTVNAFNKILITESKMIKSQVIRNKVDGLAKFAIVVTGECDTCEGGEFPLDELVLPPYHPNCECEVIYELTDEPDDIEELELETD